MRILIIGASGLVGGSLFKNLQKKKNYQVLGTYHNYALPELIPLDITKPSLVIKLLNEFKPEVIIQPAAYANVDGCEENPKLCYRINRDGVKNVIDASKKLNPFYVYFSTDYIFDGRSGPYKEEDKPNPQNIYAQVKLEIEEYLKTSGLPYLIIRTANVFGWENQGKNFVVRLIQNLKEGKEVKVITDQTVNPTYVENLTRAVIYLIENSNDGIYHVAGKSILSRFNFALLVAEIFKLDKSLIKPIKTDQIRQIAKRPIKGGLKVEKIEKILPFKLLTAKEGLEEMKKDELK